MADSRGPADQPERRAGERVDILGQLQGAVMVVQPMAVREISDHGLQIETGFPLQLDSLHELRLQLGDGSVVVKGRVVHCSVADVDRDLVAYRCGLEFVEMGAGARDLIARYIEGLRSGRQGRLGETSTT